jgi:hypothetical protein
LLGDDERAVQLDEMFPHCTHGAPARIHWDERGRI